MSNTANHIADRAFQPIADALVGLYFHVDHTRTARRARRK